MTYELRHDDNPGAMPHGTGTISVHGSERGAWLAARAEARAFKASRYASGGSYLQRIIVKCDDEGVHVLSTRAYFEAMDWDPGAEEVPGVPV